MSSPTGTNYGVFNLTVLEDDPVSGRNSAGLFSTQDSLYVVNEAAGSIPVPIRDGLSVENAVACVPVPIRDGLLVAKAVACVPVPIGTACR
jgi:hypothetical protein